MSHLRSSSNPHPQPGNIDTAGVGGAGDPHQKKDVVISEKHPQHVMSSRYISWRFELVTSGASGPATARWLVLDSIQVSRYH